MLTTQSIVHATFVSNTELTTQFPGGLDYSNCINNGNLFVSSTNLIRQIESNRYGILSGLLPIAYWCPPCSSVVATPTPARVFLNYHFNDQGRLETAAFSHNTITHLPAITLFLQPIGSLPEISSCSSSSENLCECFNTTRGPSRGNNWVTVYPLLITFRITGNNLLNTTSVKFGWSGNGYSGNFIDTSPDLSNYVDDGSGSGSGYITATWNVYCNYETFTFRGQKLSVRPYNANGETQENPSQIELYTDLFI